MPSHASRHPHTPLAEDCQAPGWSPERKCCAGFRLYMVPLLSAMQSQHARWGVACLIFKSKQLGKGPHLPSSEGPERDHLLPPDMSSIAMDPCFSRTARQKGIRVSSDAVTAGPYQGSDALLGSPPPHPRKSTVLVFGNVTLDTGLKIASSDHQQRQ